MTWLDDSVPMQNLSKQDQEAHFRFLGAEGFQPTVEVLSSGNLLTGVWRDAILHADGVCFYDPFSFT